MPVTPAMAKGRVDEVLQGSIAEILKLRGYRKHANLHVRAVGAVCHMIEVQFSSWSPKNADRFTLNCGVYVPGVTSVFWNKPEPQRPKLTDSSIYVRVGMLAPSRLDIWWEVTNEGPSDNDARIQSEIRSALIDMALPFVGRFETEQQIARFLTEEPGEEDKLVEPRAAATRKVYAGILWRKLGDEAKCTVCLVEAMRQAGKTPLKPVVEKFVARFR